MSHDEIVDRVGANDFQMAIDEFAGMNVNEVERQLDEMFNDFDNSKDLSELANCICDEVNK